MYFIISTKYKLNEDKKYIIHDIYNDLNNIKKY
jgi:hypothetical protein